MPVLQSLRQIGKDPNWALSNKIVHKKAEPRVVNLLKVQPFYCEKDFMFGQDHSIDERFPLIMDTNYDKPYNIVHI
jgi:hypothetical protein